MAARCGMAADTGVDAVSMGRVATGWVGGAAVGVMTVAGGMSYFMSWSR